MSRVVALAASTVALVSASGAAAATGPRLCDVRAFGARGDGTSLDTAAIQRAVDTCAAAGGGTVLFTPGRYVSGTLSLASHITLKLDPGATLAGSRNIADYRPGREFGLGTTLGVDVAGEGTLAGLIVARGAQDVSIVGLGVIDGEGDSFMTAEPHVAADFDPRATRNPAGSEAALHDLRYGPVEKKAGGRPGVLILFFQSSGVTVRDVTLRNSPNWTLVLQTVRRAVISGLHVDNSPLIPNNDGIDCNACRDVHIADSDIRTGDDDLAVAESEDITVGNLSLFSRSAAVRVESTQRAVFSNLTIESNRGLALFASHGLSRPIDGIRFSDVVMRTRLIPGHWWGKAEPIYVAVQPCGAAPCVGGIRNVTFSGIDAQAEAGVMIAGAPGLPVAGLTLESVRLRMIPPDPKMADAVGGDFDLRWTAPTPATGIVRHDIPAVFAREVEGLTLRDVEVTWAGPQPDYVTEAVNVSRFHDLAVDGLTERGAPPPRASSFAFSDGAGLRVERLRPAPGRPPVALRAVTDAQVQSGSR